MQIELLDPIKGQRRRGDDSLRLALNAPYACLYAVISACGPGLASSQWSPASCGWRICLEVPVRLTVRKAANLSLSIRQIVQECVGRTHIG